MPSANIRTISVHVMPFFRTMYPITLLLSLAKTGLALGPPSGTISSTSSTLNGSFPNQLIASLPNPYPVPNTRISLAFDAGGSFLSQRDIYAALNQLRGNVERDLKDGAHDYDAIPYGYIASAYQGAEVGVWSAEHQPIQMTYIYAMQVLEGLVTKLSSDGYREWSAKVLLEGQLDIGDLLLDARPLSLLD